MIQNPVDLTEDIGTYFVDGFSDLKDAISDVAKDRLYDLWFHKDQSHTYKFDDSAFSGGSIYARSKKRKERETDKLKVTASRLEPITTVGDFKKHVETIADAEYKRQTKATAKANSGSADKTKKATKKRVDHYRVQLCIIFVKEKVKKTKSSTSSSVPPPIITTSSNSTLSHSGDISIVNESTTTPPFTNDEISSKKRKSREPFRFPARKIRIILHAPIETSQQLKRM